MTFNDLLIIGVVIGAVIVAITALINFIKHCSKIKKCIQDDIPINTKKKEEPKDDEEEEEEQRTLDEKIGERFEVIIDKRNDDYNIGLIVDGKNSQEYLYFYDSYSQKTIITPLKKENEE